MQAKTISVRYSASLNMAHSVVTIKNKAKNNTSGEVVGISRMFLVGGRNFRMLTFTMIISQTDTRKVTCSHVPQIFLLSHNKMIINIVI